MAPLFDPFPNPILFSPHRLPGHLQKASRASSNLGCHPPQALPSRACTSPSSSFLCNVGLWRTPFSPLKGLICRSDPSPCLPGGLPLHPGPANHHPLSGSSPAARLPSDSPSLLPIRTQKPLSGHKSPPSLANGSYLGPLESKHPTLATKRPILGPRVQMLHLRLKCPLGGLKGPFWGLDTPSGAKCRFWKPPIPFGEPNAPLWVQMPPIKGKRRVQRRSPGPKSSPPSESARALGGPAPPCPPQCPQPRRPSVSLTMARAGCPERGYQGSSGGGSSCSSSSSAARLRLHTHCLQRAPPPLPPPAPTVPQRPPRAPRLARPRPARSARRRTAAPTDPSAPLSGLSGPRLSHSPQGWVYGRPRARAHPPRDYFPSPCAPPPVPTLLSSSAEGHLSAGA